MSKSSEGAVSTRSIGGRGRIGALVLAAGSLAILVALIGGAATATSATTTTVVLGSTASTPDPSCPELPCQAVGSTTGFQVSNGQSKLPFNVPRDGKITSWGLTLAQPTNQQRSFFNGFFGTPPEARLSILKRVPGTNPPRYSLQSQGAIRVLSPYLGKTVKFSASLQVKKGDIVGLSVPTWAPAFAQGLAANNIWRASRAPGKCTNSTDVRQGQPQTKIGTRATYGCRYTTARLLYTATLVETG
jgi:hypothetical protein